MDLFTAHEAPTLDGLFRARIRRSPEATAYLSYEESRWVPVTWADMARRVARWQQALRAEGVASGERVGLLLRNCREWVEFEQASLGLGLVVVPLYLEDRAENSAYIIQDAGVRLLLVQDSRHWQRLAPAVEGCPCLQRVVQLHGSPAGHDSRVRAAEGWLPAEAGDLAEREGDGAALATLVYTSGTTGRPKGVMLSHRNILENARAAARMGDGHFRSDDLFLSLLPLSHMLERTAGYYLPMLVGATVAYARSVQQLGDDMKAVRPTVLVAVPRLFERLYGRIDAKLNEQSPFARRLFRLAQGVGWRRFERREGRAGWTPRLWLWPLLDRLVAARVRAGFGGRLRFAISGGAALAPHIARFFISLGIEIVQGYGLTEASPVVSCNLPGDNDPASAGPPLPGIEVRVGDMDELQVRAPSVMMGYWGDPQATAQVIDPQGWLHTGDQVRIAQGRIHLTGRIKDILVLSNGEKVPPADMEAALIRDPLIDHALVLGEGRAHLAALLVLNPDEWRRYAGGFGLDPDAPESLADRNLHRQLQQSLAARMGHFPGYARIRRFALTLEPWTVENGMLTPTLKLRRARIAELHAQEIASLFE